MVWKPFSFIYIPFSLIIEDFHVSLKLNNIISKNMYILIIPKEMNTKTL